MMVDMMILFLVILIGWQIFCRERENGIYPILQTAKRGGVAFISAKLAAYFLMLAILSFLLYAAQFLFLVWDWKFRCGIAVTLRVSKLCASSFNRDIYMAVFGN